MISVFEFLEKHNDMSSPCWIIAELTDEYIVDTWPMKNNSFEKKGDKVLEIRIFNDKEEHKLFRTDIGKTFKERTISDVDNELDTITEEQYLDIDEKKGFKDGIVTATGGGRYNLPLSDTRDARIKIKYYLRKSADTGMAQIEDWRLVEFVEGK